MFTGMHRMLRQVALHPVHGPARRPHRPAARRAGGYEAIYGNLPRVGLAADAGHGPIARRGQSAARRIGVSATDEAPVPAYPNP